MTGVVRKRILFVDDEPAILAALSHSLYKERKRWDMVFVDGPERALAELRQGAFDVVVSDMRMPGMDGAALLTAIRSEFPSVVRVMLTGHAEREAIVRALPAVHLLLSKPCDAARLRGALERSLLLGALGNDTLEAMIGKIDKLPSPPQIYYDLAKALESPATSLGDIARVIRRDPAMSAKILQLVNSAYFNAKQPTSSIESAVALLGTEQLGYIVLTAAVFGTIELDPSSGFSLSRMQEAALRCAKAAERLAPEADRKEAFVAGLLHDVGQLVLALGMPERYADIAASTGSGTALIAAERAALGVTHADIGACLLAIWGVPDRIVEIVRSHHDPGGAPEPLRQLTAMVHVADALVDEALAQSPAGQHQLALDSLERAGAIDQLPAWCAKLAEETKP